MQFQLVKQAESAYQNGNWPLAEFLCIQGLESAPDNANLLHIHGAILLHNGKLVESLNILSRCAAINPLHAQVQYHLGLAQSKMEQYRNAILGFNNALSIRSDYPEAIHQRGKAYLAIEMFDLALADFESVLSKSPNYDEALFGKGMALLGNNQLHDALEYFDLAITSNPSFAEAWNNRGNVLRALGEINEALESYNWAIACKAQYADANNNRGIVLSDTNRNVEAIESFKRALCFNPTMHQALNNLARVYCKVELFDLALECCKQALQLKPDYLDAYNNLGNTLAQLKRFDEALECYNILLKSKPDDKFALSNQSVVLAELGRFHEACESAEASIMLDDSFSYAFNNRANSLALLGRYDEAMNDYLKAIKIAPFDTLTHGNKAMFLLSKGDYHEGWEEYEWRLKEDKNSHLSRFSQPIWNGQPLNGKRILLLSEQGLGDTLQFCRFAIVLREMGADVLLQVQPALKTLLVCLGSGIEVISTAEQLPEFDYYRAIMSIPHVLRTEVDTIPKSVPYLYTDEAKLRKWRNILGVSNKIRIGIVWSGNPDFKNDHNRSMAFTDVISLISEDAEFYCLQKEIRPRDADLLPKQNGLFLIGTDFEDFSDTAAAVELMDIIVTIDTSVAHLAGAMGKPLWLMLPLHADWRWLRERKDSPWYPSARLFRQTKYGDWTDVISEVKEALRTEVNSTKDNMN